jgi:hypothetical protein
MTDRSADGDNDQWEVTTMKGKKTRIIAVVAVIGALAAGGAAFTASNTLPSTSVAGYGNVSVTGATVSDIHNVLSQDGQNITEVILTFSASQTGNTVVAGFGPTSGTAPTNLNITCSVQTGGLTADCGDGTTNLAATASQNEFAVAVSH